MKKNEKKNERGRRPRIIRGNLKQPVRKESLVSAENHSPEIISKEEASVATQKPMVINEENQTPGFFTPGIVKGEESPLEKDADEGNN